MSVYPKPINNSDVFNEKDYQTLDEYEQEHSGGGDDTDHSIYLKKSGGQLTGNIQVPSLQFFDNSTMTTAFTSQMKTKLDQIQFDSSGNFITDKIKTNSILYESDPFGVSSAQINNFLTTDKQQIISNKGNILTHNTKLTGVSYDDSTTKTNINNLRIDNEDFLKSDNNYTDEDKAKLTQSSLKTTGITYDDSTTKTNITNLQIDGVDYIKSSENNYTDEDKAKVDVILNMDITHTEQIHSTHYMNPTDSSQLIGVIESDSTNFNINASNLINIDSNGIKLSRDDAFIGKIGAYNLSNDVFYIMTNDKDLHLYPKTGRILMTSDVIKIGNGFGTAQLELNGQIQKVAFTNERNIQIMQNSAWSDRIQLDEDQTIFLKPIEFNATIGESIKLNHSSITFPDLTTQTTAFHSTMISDQSDLITSNQNEIDDIKIKTNLMTVLDDNIIFTHDIKSTDAISDRVITDKIVLDADQNYAYTDSDRASLQIYKNRVFQPTFSLDNGWNIVNRDTQFVGGVTYSSSFEFELNNLPQFADYVTGIDNKWNLGNRLIRLQYAVRFRSFGSNVHVFQSKIRNYKPSDSSLTESLFQGIQRKQGYDFSDYIMYQGEFTFEIDTNDTTVLITEFILGANPNKIFSMDVQFSMCEI